MDSLVRSRCWPLVLRPDSEMLMVAISEHGEDVGIMQIPEELLW